MSGGECTICGGATFGVSSVLRVAAGARVSWECESTMKLLGWKEADVQLRYCLRCCHSIIFPTFDAALLYGDRGGAIRKQVFESHFPGKAYGDKATNNIPGNAFSMVRRELERLSNMASLASDSIQQHFPRASEIRVLDWGGGDGRVGAIYANAIGMISGIPTRNFVYDYTDWPAGNGEKIGDEGLKECGPFQIVVCSHILEHTHDPIAVVRRAAECLSPNGVVICEVPDERFLILKALLQRSASLHYHVCHFSRRSLHAMLQRAGLGNIRTAYQYDSSYRGAEISCIGAVAQKNGGAAVPRTQRPPAVFSELASMCWFTTRKVLDRFV